MPRPFHHGLVAAAALAAALPASAPPALADEAPSVVVTIRPLHSLVAGVMDGVGEPQLIVPGGLSPHTYALRPTDASMLEQADIIFWIGPDLETFLEEPIETLGANATVVTLGDAPGVTQLPVREGGAFEAHDHGHEADHDDHGHDDHAHDDHGHDEHAHDDHGHDDHAHDDHGHDDHGHDEHAHDDHAHDDHGHDDHAHADDHADHHHGTVDMHLWLDPENASAWVDVVVETLAAADPANADTYAINGEIVQANLDSLTLELAGTLSPVRDRPFIVFHDAYQYLENRFGLTVAGAITISPEVQPSAQRIAEIQQRIRELGAVCVFSEPQFEPRLVAVVTEGTEAETGVLDPLGTDLTDGPDLYFDLMRANADALVDCLS